MIFNVILYAIASDPPNNQNHLHPGDHINNNTITCDGDMILSEADIKYYDVFSEKLIFEINITKCLDNYYWASQWNKYFFYLQIMDYIGYNVIIVEIFLAVISALYVQMLFAFCLLSVVCHVQAGNCLLTAC